MDEAGIVPENNLEEEASTELDGKPVPGNASGPEEEKRLDVFEDFLKKLGTDKGGQERPTS
jgi:hypothetical protein